MNEPLLPRNKIKGYKMSVGEVTSPTELTIKYPHKVINAPKLVDFMFLVHKRKGLTPQFDFRAYLKEMKKLMEEIGGEATIALILKAGEISHHPFSVKFLRKIYEEDKSSTTNEQARPESS